MWQASPGLVEPLLPYMTTPSLWKPGAAPMTVVDFLSTQSSHGFPFCEHHPLALRGKQCTGMGDLART